MILRIQCPRCKQLFDADLTEQRTETDCTHCQEHFFAANVLSKEQFDMLPSEAEGLPNPTNHGGPAPSMTPISATGSVVQAPEIKTSSGVRVFPVATYSYFIIVIDFDNDNEWGTSQSHSAP